MTLISAAAAGPSYFSQGEGSPSPPHQSVGELVNWFSSEIHSFLGAHDLNSRVPRVVPTQSHPEGFTTFATAIIPFSGPAFPIKVVLSLVPLHIETGQYSSSLNLSSLPNLDQGGEHRSFPSSQPSEPSEPSHFPAYYPMPRGDMTKDPRCPGYAPTPGGFPVVPRNPIPRPEHDYQPSRPVEHTQKPIPAGTAAAVSASPGVAVYPPPSNPTPGSYLVPEHPLSSSLVNRSIARTTRTTYQDERKSRQSTSRQLGQAYEDTPTLLTTAGPIRGVGVDQRHQCTKCNASFARLSGLNRHHKDKHSAWMVCHRCNSEFSLGRMYKFTEHLETCPGA